MTRWLVVGGGSAGCVVAARLSEIESNEVTLVEAGPDHGSGSVGVGPVVDDPSRLRPGVRVIRRTGGEPEPYLQGFGLGGSSLVNGTIVVGDPGEWSLGHDLPIEPAAPLGPVGSAVLAASADAGRVGVVRRGGMRVTAMDAYLRPVLDRANLRVHTESPADRVVFDGRRAVGVVAGCGECGADRVVLCAGAIETPAILLRSGVDTPGVGQGLQDHVGVAFSFDLAPSADAVPIDAVPIDAVPIGVTIERPGRQIVVIDRLADVASMGALLAGQLAVVSEGQVVVAADGSIRVELNQLSEAAGLDGLAVVAREALDLLRRGPVADVIGDVYIDADGTPARALSEDASLRSWLLDHLSGYHHLAGSCRTGIALDEDGALVGYEGVYVCDASALPGVPYRNPYLTVIRHAEAMSRRWTAV